MAVFSIEFIKQGMVLGADVRGDSGQLLLSAGTEITAKHIDTLRGLGVGGIDIKGTTEDDVESAMLQTMDPVRLEEAEAELRDLFRHTDLSYAPIQELLRLCTLRKVG
jgi:hypothetical protein